MTPAGAVPTRSVLRGLDPRLRDEVPAPEPSRLTMPTSLMDCRSGPAMTRKKASWVAARPRLPRRRGCGVSLARGPALEVGFDHELAAATEARAVDLQVLHDARDIIAGLGDRDPLDPVHRIDMRIARIAVSGDPLFHAATPGVVAGESKDIGAVVAAEQIG